MLLVFEHLFIIAICLILKLIDIPDGIVGMFFVITSSIATSLFVIGLKNVNKWAKIVILAGLVIRIILIFVDVFGVRLPDTGTDDDGFYRESLKAYNDGNYDFSQNKHGNFSAFLAIMYFMIGSSRISAQYLNALFYVLSAIFLLQTMVNLGIIEKKQKIVLIILCFMPNSILFNSILRRETIMEFCACSSMLYFSKWYKNYKTRDALLTVIFIALASLFHTAFIIAAPLFIIYFALYDKKKCALSFSITNATKLLIVLSCAIVIGVAFLSLFRNKFSSLSDLDDIYTTANRARGGSVYLANYKVSTIGQLFLFTPLKLFYFLFSPVPWMFRNAMDIVSFALDALVYISLILVFIRSKKTSCSKLFFTVFTVLSIVFALGTFNSGTAIRHRFSVLPHLLVAYSLTDKRKRSDDKLAKKEDNRTAIGVSKKRRIML